MQNPKRRTTGRKGRPSGQAAIPHVKGEGARRQAALFAAREAEAEKQAR